MLHRRSIRRTAQVKRAVSPPRCSSPKYRLPTTRPSHFRALRTKLHHRSFLLFDNLNDDRCRLTAHLNDALQTLRARNSSGLEAPPLFFRSLKERVGRTGAPPACPTAASSPSLINKTRRPHFREGDLGVGSARASRVARARTTLLGRESNDNAPRGALLPLPVAGARAAGVKSREKRS